MAYAALERLGLEGEAAQVFDPFEVVPQIGQGALAVEFRKGDSRVELLLKAIDHQPTRLAVEAERALLGRLGSGCALPVGAHAIFRQSENLIEMVGFIGLTDGSFGVRVSGKGKDPKELGARLGDALLSRGGKRILESLDTGDANGQP